MFALNIGDDGRILSATYEEYAPDDSAIVETLPEGDISNYIYNDGEYVYDPLPGPESEETITADGFGSWSNSTE